MTTSDFIPALEKLASVVAHFQKVWQLHEECASLRSQMKLGHDLWNRRSWAGHLTASAAVLNKDSGRVLFVHHKKLNRWLLPGGHCDPYEMPWISAQRELEEETGVHDAQLHHWHQDNEFCPLDIDSHQIPATPAELQHVHHDFRYVFTVTGDIHVSVQAEEVASANWLDIDVLTNHYRAAHARIGKFL